MEYKQHDLNEKSLIGSVAPADEGAGFFTLKTAEIGRRHVWLYKVQCPIGNIFIVEAEQPSMEIKSWLIHYDAKKALDRFNTCVKKILKGVTL